jgi:hypothetical protein
MLARAQVLGVFLALALFATACKKQHRIGEYVLVEWEEGKLYPAYITEMKSKTRYRVHYDGYDAKWDEDVTLDRIKGVVRGKVVAPPPPKKVERSLGAAAAAAGSASPVSEHKVGDRVRVRWRGSVYQATIINVVERDEYLVHYDGHETAWDEVIKSERIVGR